MNTALRSVALLAAALVAAGGPARAQFGPSRAAVAIGVVALDGSDGESGAGLLGAAQITIATSPSHRFAVEVGLQALWPFVQVCTLGVPGACSPATPASPVWHFRALGSRPVAGALYVTAGLGGYGPAGSADRPHTMVLGLDAGLGLRVSSRTALEARYLHLRADRFVSWAFPLALVVGL